MLMLTSCHHLSATTNIRRQNYDGIEGQYVLQNMFDRFFCSWQIDISITYMGPLIIVLRMNW